MTYGIGSFSQGISALMADQEMMKGYKPYRLSKRDKKVKKCIDSFFKSKGIQENDSTIYVLWGGKPIEIKVINSDFSDLAKELAEKIKQELNIESEIWIKPVAPDPFANITPEEYFNGL